MNNPTIPDAKTYVRLVRDGQIWSMNEMMLQFLYFWHCIKVSIQRCPGTSKILQWWNHTNWIIDILALQISRFSWQITQNNESKSILKFKYGSGSWIEQNTDADFKFRFDLIFIPGPYLPVSMWCCHPSYFTMSQFCPNQHIWRFIPSQKETFSYGPALAHVAEV